VPYRLRDKASRTRGARLLLCGRGGVFDALEHDRKAWPRTLEARTATVVAPSPGRRRLRPGHTVSLRCYHCISRLAFGSVSLLNGLLSNRHRAHGAAISFAASTPISTAQLWFMRLGEMRLPTRVGSVCAYSVLGALILLWIVLIGILLLAHGDPEALLARTFDRHSRPDAFAHLNGVLVQFWTLHTVLILLAAAATRFRRHDVLTVLLVGPIMGLILNLLAHNWKDPEWFAIVAVFSIYWLVGTLVGGVYWAARRRTPKSAPYGFSDEI
jgi:hypothetical protein